jgi:hypothetical protein
VRGSPAVLPGGAADQQADVKTNEHGLDELLLGDIRRFRAEGFHGQRGVTVRLTRPVNMGRADDFYDQASKGSRCATFKTMMEIAEYVREASPDTIFPIAGIRRSATSIQPISPDGQLQNQWVELPARVPERHQQYHQSADAAHVLTG